MACGSSLLLETLWLYISSCVWSYYFTITNSLALPVCVSFAPSLPLPHCVCMLLIRTVANTVTHLCSHRHSCALQLQPFWHVVTQQWLQCPVTGAPIVSDRSGEARGPLLSSVAMPMAVAVSMAPCPQSPQAQNSPRSLLWEHNT